MFAICKIAASSCDYRELSCCGTLASLIHTPPADRHLLQAAAADGYAAAEQPDGAVVADALSDAARVRIAPRVQGVVLQPRVRHDRGQHRVQREHHQAAPQGQRTAVLANARNLLIG